MKKILFALVGLMFMLPLCAQEKNEGIKFFQGTFDEALAQAKKEGKPLFVDFYAVWCGPCKRIAREVFPLKSVGDYFNQKFISLQLDAEAPENVEVAKKYKVEAFPTLAFISNDGTPISIMAGGVDEKTLLENAKIALGEAIGFEKLYDMYKKDKSNLSIQQDLLTQAPSFLSAQDGMDAERWVVRIRKLFREYIDQKMGPALINKQDYIIFTSLADEPEVIDKLVNFVNTNLPAWQEAVGDAAAYYVIERNDAKIEELAKKGDESYKTYLDKINGEYKDAYGVIQSENHTPYEKSKSFYDGLFMLFKNSNADEYIRLMEDYFKMSGESGLSSEYGRAAQNLYSAMGGKLKKEHHQVAIKWITEALKFENPLMERINFLVMIGDSYKELGDYDKAQTYYNQGFSESYQMKDMDMVKEMIQGTIIRKTAELELLRK